MHTHFTYFAILAVVALFPQLSLATWSLNKAAEINFYVDTQCTQYNGEADAWWTGSPLVGSPGSTTAAPTSGNSTTIELGQGYCTFWDDFTCSGNQISSTPGDGVCQPARSQGGFLWKSAKCFSTTTTVTLPPPPPPLTSPNSSTLPSSTFQPPSSFSINFNPPPTSSSSTSHLTSSLPSSPSTSSRIPAHSSSTLPPGLSSSISETAILSATSQPDIHAPSAITQPDIRAISKSLSGTAMAGVIAGVVCALILAALLGFCIWRRRKSQRQRREALLPTHVFFPGPTQHDEPPVWEKSARGSAVTSSGPRPLSPGVESRQQSVVTELRSLLEQQERLNSANSTNADRNTDLELQNDALKARIRALERELHLYVGSELSDGLPP
ncbi:hypothetical protein MVEN_01600900 [Mycena venus]|uniref:Uncharacterized protein n=1 Tax=Mycena venus TaxID=2733690 RepID=A0A8H6XT22_9AGAR|nr:hypothetical protein MVEN_01600900 [Mycena venus]